MLPNATDSLFTAKRTHWAWFTQLIPQVNKQTQDTLEGVCVATAESDSGVVDDNIAVFYV